MRTRYSLDDSTLMLVDRNGEQLGRVVSITIDDSPPATPERLGYGVAVPSALTEADPVGGKGTEVPHTPRQAETETVHRVWDYWIEISGKRQRLDSKRERILRNALKLVGEEPVKLALLGLSRSPWHQGQNEQHKTYMEIRYALKGIGDESDDERIEKAISWAANYAPDTKPMEEAKVQRLLDQVRYTLSLPHRPNSERAKEAWRTLRDAGFNVIKLEAPPWARIER